MQYIALKELKKNPNNPRIIKDEGFKKLLESLKSKRGKDHFEARPCIVSTRTGENIIIAGNTRYQAAKDLGWEEVPTVIMEGLTEEQEQEIIIRDNVSNGEWDYLELKENWDTEKLEEWGVDIPEKKENTYTNKIEAPIYEITGEMPDITELFDCDKSKNVLEEIEVLNVSEDVKEFLRYSAYRLCKFNYSKIAEFYAHQNKDIQEVMEKMALIIIDYDKAIELGYTRLHDTINDMMYE